MTLLAGLVAGLLAGTHIATWGMYKDAPHEGFRRYPRSIGVGAVVGLIIVSIVPKDWLSAGALTVLFGVAYACERGATEFYKMFLRHEDQSKFFIPMEFHVFGRVVPPGRRRILIGVGHLLVFVLVGLGVHAAQSLGADLPKALRFGLIGSSLGWLVAAGGAFKDAPIEGFEWLKFFRSPVAAGLFAALLSPFTNSYVLASIGGAGYSVAAIETYKTFFFPNKPRGKFAGKPILFPEILRLRQRFIPLYAAIWAIVIGTFALAYASL